MVGLQLVMAGPNDAMARPRPISGFPNGCFWRSVRPVGVSLVTPDNGGGSAAPGSTSTEVEAAGSSAEAWVRCRDGQVQASARVPLAWWIRGQARAVDV